MSAGQLLQSTSNQPYRSFGAFQLRELGVKVKKALSLVSVHTPPQALPRPLHVSRHFSTAPRSVCHRTRSRPQCHPIQRSRPSILGLANCLIWSFFLVILPHRDHFFTCHPVASRLALDGDSWLNSLKMKLVKLSSGHRGIPMKKGQ